MPISCLDTQKNEFPIWGETKILISILFYARKLLNDSFRFPSFCRQQVSSQRGSGPWSNPHRNCWYILQCELSYICMALNHFLDHFLHDYKICSYRPSELYYQPPHFAFCDFPSENRIEIQKNELVIAAKRQICTKRQNFHDLDISFKNWSDRHLYTCVHLDNNIFGALLALGPESEQKLIQERNPTS